MFQEDIFPDCASYEPALSADEWISGKNADPKLMSLKDGFKPTGKPIFVAPVIKETKADPTENPTTDKEVSLLHISSYCFVALFTWQANSVITVPVS